MTCNPWRWLWGLLLLAPLTWITLHLNQAAIEDDLRVRAKESLESMGLNWAQANFSGRDATLTGRAADEAEPKKAGELVRGTWGVRVVDLRTDLIDKVDKYVWSATRSDGKRVKLSGFVPGEQSRRAVLSAAKAALPGFRIDDAMTLARGAPKRDVFMSGISFGLKQLAALKQGEVELADTGLSIAGQAADQASLKAVRTQLKSGLPKGITLVRDAITGPVVEAYTWTAQLSASQVLLSGYVPSAELRDQLFAEVKKLFPRLTVVDRSDVAAGEPAGFARASKAALQQLYQLREGTAQLAGNKIKLKGLAEDEPTAQAVRRAFGVDVAPLIGTADISAPKSVPVAATPEATGPYTTAAKFDGSVIELTGFVQSEDERIAVVAATRGKFPDLTVKDNLTVRPGADGGHQACLMAGVSSLGRLTSGEVTLTGMALSLSGQTNDDVIAAEIPQAVRGAVSQGCVPSINVTSTGRVQAEARRKADEAARLAAEAEARRKADEAARISAEEAAKRRAAEEEAQRLKAAEEARIAARKVEAERCQNLLAEAQAAGAILFKRADWALDAKSKPTLDRLARIVNECPNFKVSVEGHTDSEGIPERNNPLSERRAAAVVTYLIEAGVDPGRLSSVGYGAERPIADNETAEGRAKNRRIEFKVNAE